MFEKRVNKPEAITRLANNGELRKQMGEAGKWFEEYFTIEQAVKRCGNALVEVLNKYHA